MKKYRSIKMLAAPLLIFAITPVHAQIGHQSLHEKQVLKSSRPTSQTQIPSAVYRETQYTYDSYYVGKNRNFTGIWLQPFYEGGKQHTEGDLVGYRFNVGGFTLGIDTAFSQNSIIGIAGSYTNSKVKSVVNDVANTDIYSYLGTLYGGWRNKHEVYFDWMLSIGKNYNKGYRDISAGPVTITANSKYNSQQYSAQAILSKRNSCNSVTFVPRVSVNYTYLHRQPYTETNAGLLDQAYNSKNSATLTVGTGFSLEQYYATNLGTFAPDIHAYVYYDAKSDDQNTATNLLVGGPVISTTGRPGRVAGQFGVGLTHNMSDHFTLKLNYEYMLRKAFNNNVVYAKLYYVF